MEMSSAESSTAPAWAEATGAPGGPASLTQHVGTSLGERDVVCAPPRHEERVRRDSPVVPVLQQVDGVDLEVQMGDSSVGVTRVADEAQHVPCLHSLAGDRER